tara:strand:+ start:26 stop:241 length:216 start_codon:yes stop_codon:yes gene_type:complete
MNIAKCNIDQRGRITLPLAFFHANNINPKDYSVTVTAITGSEISYNDWEISTAGSVKLTFIKKTKGKQNNA